MILVAVFIAVLFLAGSLGAWAWVLAALAAVAWYLADVRRHPRVACRWPGCKGSGASYSRVGDGRWLRRPFGDCRCCGGKKAHPRLALRVVAPDRYKSIRTEIERAKGKTR